MNKVAVSISVDDETAELVIISSNGSSTMGAIIRHKQLPFTLLFTPEIY